MQAGKQKKKFLVIAITALLLVFLFVGCNKSKTNDYSIPNIEENENISSDLTFEAVSSEASQVISGDLILDKKDPFLLTLSEYQPELEESEEEGGPVDVNIVYPPNSALLSESKPVRAYVESDGEIESVTFYLDGKEVSKLTEAPYEWVFNPENTTKAKHTVKVVAKSGDYTGEDSLVIYNVVTGKVVILPWEPAGGNIPYSHIRTFYPPEQEMIDAAAFTKYTDGTYYVDFEKTLPAGYAYLAGEFKIDGLGIVVKYIDDQTTIPVKFYDYSKKKYSSEPLSAISLENIGGGKENYYEEYTFKDYKKTEGINYEPDIIPFYGFDPFTKKVRIRITGSLPAKFMLFPMEIKYYAVRDESNPVVNYRKVRKEGSDTVIEAYFSEPVFVTLYAYSSSGKLIATKSEQKPEGWDEISTNVSGVSKLKLKVTDCGGHTIWTKYISAP